MKIYKNIKDKVFAFVDVETSGATPGEHGVIDIGILRVKNNKVIGRYNQLINPKRHINSFVSTLTGITDEVVANAPTFTEVKEEIFELLDGAIFVAHNSKFDYSFIRQEFAKEEIKFSAPELCTVKLSRSLYPQFKHHNLDAVIERHGFICENRHRAYDDAEVLYKFFLDIQEEFDEETLEKSFQEVIKEINEDEEKKYTLAKNLPKKPGVYIFYDKENTPLYVGKSVNIRSRVMSHFYNNAFSSNEFKLYKLTDHIEAIETSGELSALINEAELIKTMKPVFNKLLRENKGYYVIKEETNEKGYKYARIIFQTTLPGNRLNEYLGIYKTKKKALSSLGYKSSQFNICRKMVGLEHTKTSCFAYRLGNCDGACMGEEAVEAHNEKFNYAFSKNKIHEWPYKGPILISEIDNERRTGDLFVVNQWCLINKIRIPDEEVKIVRTSKKIFDIDFYNIVSTFLDDKNNSYKIKKLFNTDEKLESMNLF